MAATEDASGNTETLASQQLPELAAYMGVESVTLSQIFHVVAFKSDKLWKLLAPILSSGSLCGNIYELYHEKAIHDFAHARTRHVTLRALRVALSTASGTVSVPIGGSCDGSTTRTIKKYYVPQTIVAGLVRIEKAHRRDKSEDDYSQRCEQVHKEFRLSLARRNESGYLCNLWTERHVEDAYIYIPQNLLNGLLEELGDQIQGGADKLGPRVSKDGRWAVLYFRQLKRKVSPNDVAMLSATISSRKQWGPFPAILHWGVLCVTDQNGSCKCVWPNGITDVAADNLKAPINSFGLRFPVYGA